jgi:hypothetical protein
MFQLSEGVWNKFMIYQQTEDTFKKKMSLWKYLSNFIQVIAKSTCMRCMSELKVIEIKVSKKKSSLK